jgi:hypothetical protein
MGFGETAFSEMSWYHREQYYLLSHMPFWQVIFYIYLKLTIFMANVIFFICLILAGFSISHMLWLLIFFYFLDKLGNI